MGALDIIPEGLMGLWSFDTLHIINNGASSSADALTRTSCLDKHVGSICPFSSILPRYRGFHGGFSFRCSLMAYECRYLTPLILVAIGNNPLIIEDVGVRPRVLAALSSMCALECLLHEWVHDRYYYVRLYAVAPRCHAAYTAAFKDGPGPGGPGRLEPAGFASA